MCGGRDLRGDGDVWEEPMWGVEARWYLLDQTRNYGVEGVRLGRKQPQRRAWHCDDFDVGNGKTNNVDAARDQIMAGYWPLIG